MITKCLAWIVFIGLCIKTGALLTSFFISIAVNGVAARDLYMGLDLSALKTFSQPYYVCLMLLVIITWATKAYLFYIVIKIFLKINLAHPFSEKMADLLTQLSYISLVIGIFALVASKLSEDLTHEGIALDTLNPFVAGGAEFLFLAGILFTISIVFKRGIEIQAENDLTV